ncbi:MAG: PilZ domain-containing protein [Rubrivivax sp.]|nr:MAG: PilZ domain-containing protein [Rubrivivax sp.]
MNNAPLIELGLRALKLRPGIALQTQAAAPGSRPEEAQFLAAIEGKGVMVGPHGASGGKSALKPGAEYTVRGFTGQYDFSFSAQVIQTFEVPFAYALLVYPKAVQARMVRRSLRMKTALPAKVSLPGKTSFVEGTLIDVSAQGAMVHTSTTVGAMGDVVELALSVEFEGETVNLAIPATICHSNKAEADGGVNVGLSFKAVSQRDKLVLHYLVQSSAE